MEDKKLQEAIASLAKEGKREALAQLLVEYIQPGHITTDFISMLLNTRAMKPGDALVKKVRKGMRVRTLVPGAIHLASEITVSDRMNYILDGADIKVTANQWELELGEIGTVQEIRNEMMAKLRDYYMNKVFTALTTVWTVGNTPNNYISLGTSLTATALKNAIDYINTRAGGVKAVVGTRAALTPVTTFGAGWTDSAGDLMASYPNIAEIMATGWLGKYYGAPLIVLNQEYDNAEDYNKLIPEDKVLVIGQNVGEFITYGNVLTKEYTDPKPTPPQWFLEIYQQFGMIIDNAQGIYVIGNIT